MGLKVAAAAAAIQTHTHTFYTRSSIWKLHEGSLGCASISVMTSKPRGHARKTRDRTFPRPFRRVLSSVSSKRPSSKAVFPANVSRAVFIFVFATFLQDERVRMEVFVFVPDRSYCLASRFLFYARHF